MGSVIDNSNLRPVQSMTGFGFAGGQINEIIDLTIEVKSVNSKYLEVSLRAPDLVKQFENEILILIKEKFKRGKFDITVNVSSNSSLNKQVVLNELLFNQLYGIAEKVESIVGSKNFKKTNFISEILGFSGVIEIEKAPQVEIGFVDIKDFFIVAFDNLYTSRAEEGGRLCVVLDSYIKQLESLIAEIEVLKESANKMIFEKISKRVSDLILNYDSEIDQSRLAQEVAILSEKTDISEEIDRLNSHMETYREIMLVNEVGKKLDFLTQELLREVNTIGSKAQNIGITKLVIEAKSLVDKIKEQASNLQ